MTLRASRTRTPDVERRRSQASHDDAVSIASRISIRTATGSGSSSGAKVALRFSRRRASAAATASRTPGEVGRPAHQGAPDGCDLLVEPGTVVHDPLDPPLERQRGGALRQVRPDAAELEGGDELVQLVHVGEVVEHEAERDAGLLGHRLGRRVRVAGAEQLHQRLGDTAPCPLASGHPAVGGGHVRRRDAVGVGGGWLRERGIGHAETRVSTPAEPHRPPPQRRWESLDCLPVSVGNPTAA